MRTLARERVAPRAAEIDKTAEFPWDVVELFREHGLFGLPFEERYGGTGTGALMVLVAIEELSKVCATSGLILAVQELGSLALKLAGTDEQKDRWLPLLASGESLCAYALTEAGLRLGLGGDADRGAPRGRRVRPQRLEAVHHQRGRGGDVHGVCEDRSLRGPLRHLGVRRRGDRAGVRGRADRAEDGDQGLDHRRALLRRLPDPRREPARRGGRGLQARDAGARPLAPRRRRAGARDRAGRDRLRARVRADARDDGKADRPAPADRGQARRHGGALRGRARRALQGRA